MERRLRIKKESASNFPNIYGLCRKNKQCRDTNSNVCQKNLDNQLPFSQYIDWYASSQSCIILGAGDSNGVETCPICSVQEVLTNPACQR